MFMSTTIWGIEMKDYASMSDFEINKLVAIANGYPHDDCDIAKLNNPTVGVEWDDDTGYATKTLDYCNNPADAWPILLDSHIAVVPYQHTLPQAWPTAFGLSSKFTTEDSNPLRAGMIVFLKLRESKND
jgi:hypothetical protein